MVLPQACRRGGMADAADSKSVWGDSVWVQVPSPALKEHREIDAFLFAYFYFKTIYVSGELDMIMIKY